jgi:2,4'-dihydroxyacetophenone dioxygenase
MMDNAAAGLPAFPAMQEARHIGIDELPFVALGDGSHIQVLQIDLKQGLWVVRMRFEPGCTIVKHQHTGPVFAVTAQGTWHYLEYPESKNRPGSYLFEPAGSVHTLHVPPGQTEDTIVWFAVFGANLNLGPLGQVEMVIDARTVLGAYRTRCAAMGLTTDKLIVVGEDR